VIQARALNRFRGPGQSDRSTSSRKFILHADDFGMNDAVTNGILEGFRDGLLTSTSVLTNAPGCIKALESWKELLAQFAVGGLPSSPARQQLSDSAAPFDLGIHLNLTQGRPLTGEKFPPELLDRRGMLPGVAALAQRLLIGGWKYRDSIEQELRSQIEVLLDHGISPTHLNAHQYVDTFPVVASVVPALLLRYTIPVVRVPWENSLATSTLLHRFEPLNWCLGQIKRLFAYHYLLEMGRRGIAHPAGYFGTSHAGRIDLSRMRIFISAAKAGFTEIGMHPGCPTDASQTCAIDDAWHDPLDALRPHELSLLKSPELAMLFETHHIRLSRLSELTALHKPVAV
jgi:predicted glycoside hydrolase/deacetylase ChbG (UPF0249 family)